MSHAGSNPFALDLVLGTLLGTLCLGIAMLAHADTVSINDNGYDPGGPMLPNFTLKTTRNGTSTNMYGFGAASYTYSLIQPKTRGLEWSNYTRLDNMSDEGENVAVYGQGWKNGKGATWGGVFEAEDQEGSGTVIGAEVDVGSFGPASGKRTGLLVVTGNTRPERGTAVIDHGIAVLPAGGSDQSRVRYGVLVAHDCDVACFAVKTGQAYALDSFGSVLMRYDPKSRRIVFQVDGEERFGISIDNGTMYTNGVATNTVTK